MIAKQETSIVLNKCIHAYPSLESKNHIMSPYAILVSFLIVQARQLGRKCWRYLKNQTILLSRRVFSKLLATKMVQLSLN